MLDFGWDCDFCMVHKRTECITRRNIKEYMSYISNQKYEQMYEMIDVGASGNICQEDFMKRNSAIYEGIGVDNIKNSYYIL